MRTHITFVIHSSHLCYVTLRTQVVRLNSGILGPQKTGSGVFIIEPRCVASAWDYGRSGCELGTRLAHYVYPPALQKIILFDKYDQEAPSAKDHKRIRRGKAKEVRLPANTPIPYREVILHKQVSAQQLSMPVSTTTQHSAQATGLCRYTC